MKIAVSIIGSNTFSEYQRYKGNSYNNPPMSSYVAELNKISHFFIL